MALRTIRTPPAVDDFIPLSEYNATTPQSFDAKAVLHQLARATTIKVPTSDYEQNSELKQLAGEIAPAADQNGDIHIPNIDVWVSSRSLTLHSPSHSTGLSIPYPSITVTAQDGAEVLLELTLSPPDIPDEDIEVLQFRILPTSIEFPENDDHVANEVETNGAVNGSSASPPASASLFRAISKCQDLNPDPRLPGDEDDEDDEMAGGGFDETAPGATGWITSENMAEFMDEEGNFRMPGGVTVIGDEGEFEDAEDGVAQVGGAGSVRRRDEAEEGDGEGESKWQRTS